MPNPIITEELELLANISALLRHRTGPVTPDEAPIVRDLEDIREQLLSRSDRKDVGALTQQWYRQSHRSRAGPPL